MLIFALRKEIFEKHEEYSVTKQVSKFLSIAHPHASLLNGLILKES